MAKRDKYIDKRAKFCQLALQNPKQAASELKDLATGLENCRNTSDVINALSSIFHVSDRTITRDLLK